MLTACRSLSHALATASMRSIAQKLFSYGSISSRQDFYFIAQK